MESLLTARRIISRLEKSNMKILTPFTIATSMENVLICNRERETVSPDSWSLCQGIRKATMSRQKRNGKASMPWTAKWTYWRHDRALMDLNWYLWLSQKLSRPLVVSLLYYFLLFVCLFWFRTKGFFGLRVFETHEKRSPGHRNLSRWQAEKKKKLRC